MAHDFSNASVLVVDDDPMATKFIKAILEGHGIADIVCVENGQQAVDAVAYHPDFDLAFTDIVMPEMNGFDLVKSLGRSGFAGKVAVMSGRGRHFLDKAGDVGGFFGSQVVAKLSKPLQPQQISRVLDKVYA